MSLLSHILAQTLLLTSKVQLVTGLWSARWWGVPSSAKLLNSNSIQLWNSLCVAGHEGLNGGIQIIPLPEPVPDIVS